MGAAVALRGDVDAIRLRALARGSGDAGQARRLLALAAIYEGGSLSLEAAIGGVGLQTVHDWALRFNAAGPDGLIDDKAAGKPPKLDETQRQALARMIEEGADPGVQKTSPPAWRRSRRARPRASPVDIWFQDEARIGQKTRSRADGTAGTRPCAVSSTRNQPASSAVRWRQWPRGFSLLGAARDLLGATGSRAATHGMKCWTTNQLSSRPTRKCVLNGCVPYLSHNLTEFLRIVAEPPPSRLAVQWTGRHRHEVQVGAGGR